MFKRVLGISLCFTFALSSVVYAASSGLRQQQEAAANERDAYMAQIQRTDANITQTEREIDQLENSLLNILNELSDLGQQVSETRIILEDTGKELEDAIEDREYKQEILVQRLVAMYMNGPTTYLELIFGASSFSEAFRRMEYMNRIAAHDQNLVEEFVAIEEAIEEKRDSIEREYTRLTVLERQVEDRLAQHQATLEDLDNRRAALGVERQTQVAGLREMEASYEYLGNLIRQEERAARARQHAVTQSNNRVVEQTTGRDGDIRWPVPSRNVISSPFGGRRSPITGRQETHHGIDIPAPTGSDIIAAEAGTVTFAGWQNGFGHTVIIYHGDNFSTLYAHNSRNLVSAGTWVDAGQVIAAIGSTGWSTGPHLHFETRINGTAQNPMNMLN